MYYQGKKALSMCYHDKKTDDMGYYGKIDR